MLGIYIFKQLKNDKERDLLRGPPLLFPYTPAYTLKVDEPRKG